MQLALENKKELNYTHRQFVFMASHEFRTPLAIIDGSTRLLMANPDSLTPERLLKRCEKIRNAVSRMTSLIDSTLTAARLDAGVVEVTPAPCDVTLPINGPSHGAIKAVEI
ncbi:MAG: histidine kinase dimerization/phospho-acceptor domain-containing protein [Alphaproteobacteria bacterium]